MLSSTHNVLSTEDSIIRTTYVMKVLSTEDDKNQSAYTSDIDTITYGLLT